MEGTFSTVGDNSSTLGDTSSTVGIPSVLWRLFSRVGIASVQWRDTFSTVGVPSVQWRDTFSTVGDNISTVEVAQYSGDKDLKYYEYSKNLEIFSRAYFA